MKKATPEETRSIHSETSDGWEIVAKHKYRAGMEKRIRALRANEYVWSKEQLDELHSLCRSCRRVIHLQCSAGFETLSFLSLGVHEVVGVDISKDMIDQARKLTQTLEAPAEWHCCDVLDAPSDLNGTADLVYTGGGALPWIMDIEAWSKVIARLLRPGGQLYLREGHPLSFMWDLESKEYRLSPGPSYCEGGVVENRGYPSGTIADHTDPTDRPTMRERVWPLGDVINSLIRAGLVIKYFCESDDPGWPAVPNMPHETLHRLPHMYTLQAENPR